MRPIPVLAASLLLSCGTSKLTFTAGAVESLPQQAASGQAVSTGQSISGEPQLAKFFAQECHLYPEVNFCPAGVAVSANGGMNATKFTSTTLLGLVYHAELYSGGLRSSCGGRTGKVSASSLTAAKPGGDPARFIIPALDGYSCVEARTDPDGPVYQAYSVTSGHQSTLNTRYRAASPSASITQTDVFQVDVAMDQQGAATFLAFNFAGVASMSARAVLLVNLVNHRFAVKYLSGPRASAQHVVAVGVGGVDRASGQKRPGFYAAWYSQEKGAPKHACVDNATQLIEVDDTECKAAGVPVTWSDSGAIADYLGLSAAERTRLAPWLAKFTSPSPLATDETPDGDADVDLSFPKSMQ